MRGSWGKARRCMPHLGSPGADGEGKGGSSGKNSLSQTLLRILMEGH